VAGIQYEDSKNVTGRFIDYKKDSAKIFIGESEIAEF
jgi:hypothetical protein